MSPGPPPRSSGVTIDWAGMNQYYNLERLTRGIDILATHPGPVKGRLVAAFHDSLCSVMPAALPGPAFEIWDEMGQMVTAVPAGDHERAFRLSIDPLQEAEAVILARSVLIVKLLVRVNIASHGNLEVLD
jgi:hypothetical protein